MKSRVPGTKTATAGGRIRRFIASDIVRIGRPVY